MVVLQGLLYMTCISSKAVVCCQRSRWCAGCVRGSNAQEVVKQHRTLAHPLSAVNFVETSITPGHHCTWLPLVLGYMLILYCCLWQVG